MLRSKGIFLGAMATLVFVALALRFFSPVRYVELEVKDVRIKAEIVATSEAKRKGLSGRSGLAEGEGMLFVFSQAGAQGFWMGGMNFPIDIIWMKDGQVIDIASNVPPPGLGQDEKTLPIYYPRLPSDRVLEVQAGLANKIGLKLGDRVDGL